MQNLVVDGRDIAVYAAGILQDMIDKDARVYTCAVESLVLSEYIRFSVGMRLDEQTEIYLSYTRPISEREK